MESEKVEERTDLFCRFGDERVAILYAEVGSRLSGEEAELSVLRFTGCVRDAPQRVRHLHALKNKNTYYCIIARKIKVKFM